MATLTCASCASQFESREGYLRPEGFLCGNCYRERCKDPAYVAEMERQLTGLLTTIADASRTGGGGRLARKEEPFVVSTPHGHVAVDSLVGLSVGDALGARFEGLGFDAGRLELVLEPAGMAPFTDDTQMALSLVEVLVRSGTVEQDDLARAFGRRYEPWRGYGPGMHRLLPQLHEGRSWRELKDQLFPGGSYGNGSAMRVAPLGAYFRDRPIDVVVSEAERSAEVTHAHPEARAGAAAVAVASWLAARSRGRPTPAGSELLPAVRTPLDPSLRVTGGIDAASRLSPDAELSEAVARLGNGAKVTCFDTVPLALWIAFRHLDDFEAAIRHAVAAGGDTDTVAAIAGGIVAARVGVDAIPTRWREAVEPLPPRLEGR